jgi:MFS superfamily sulfate permease-like transporter
MDDLTKLNLLVGIITPIVIVCAWLINRGIKNQSNNIISKVDKRFDSFGKSLIKVDRGQLQLQVEMKNAFQILGDLSRDFKEHKKETDSAIKDISTSLIKVSVEQKQKTKLKGLK